MLQVSFKRRQISSKMVMCPSTLTPSSPSIVDIEHSCFWKTARRCPQSWEESPMQVEIWLCSGRNLESVWLKKREGSWTFWGSWVRGVKVSGPAKVPIWLSYWSTKLWEKDATKMHGWTWPRWVQLICPKMCTWTLKSGSAEIAWRMSKNLILSWLEEWLTKQRFPWWYCSPIELIPPLRLWLLCIQWPINTGIIYLSSMSKSLSCSKCVFKWA